MITESEPTSFSQMTSEIFINVEKPDCTSEVTSGKISSRALKPVLVYFEMHWQAEEKEVINKSTTSSKKCVYWFIYTYHII